MPQQMTDQQWIPLNDTSRIFATHAESLSTKLLETARSGSWLNGANVRAFAEAFATYLGVRHVLPVANGTDALELVMRAVVLCRRPRGIEVVTVANAGGYAVTASRQVGLTPVFADIDQASQLADLDAILAALGPETAMVIVTHLYGGVVNVPELRQRMDNAGYSHIAIVEDCAQAHGADCAGRRIGSLGDIAAFSFYPTKNLGALGDAGAIATSDSELYKLVWELHQYGWSEKYKVAIAGGRNSRMDELQAASLMVLLPHLDTHNRRRVELLTRYRQWAPDDVRFVASPTGTVAHLAVALCPRRDAFRQHLRDRMITTEIHYPVLDCDQPGWLGLPQRIGPRGLAKSQQSVEQIVTVPCFPFMTSEEEDRILNALEAWGRK
jgi:dTDP-4-amino-4,6-dideoxygalactose transaminase